MPAVVLQRLDRLVRGSLVYAAFVLLVAAFSPAASAVTIDFRNAGGGAGGYGNSLALSAGGISVQVSAWAETGSEQPAGSGYFRFETAEVYGWSSGLGICNRSEGLAYSTCDNNEHEVDTVGRDDLLVLVFDRPVQFLNLTVDPHDGPGSDPNDRDVLYWVGNSLSPLNFRTHTFDSLSSLPGFGPGTLSEASSSYNPFTHALTGTGNVLLISGNSRDRGCIGSNITGPLECESWKLKSINVMPEPQAIVPIPGAAALMVGALAALGALRRRTQSAETGR